MDETQDMHGKKRTFNLFKFFFLIIFHLKFEF